MRQELLLIEKIELYLEGKLSPKETSLFEKELHESVDLQNEVELQRQIMGGIQRSVTKKQVALAFIKYKKIALLMKLGAIGSGAAVATIGTVLIINHLSSQGEKSSQPNSDKTPVKTELSITDTLPDSFSKDTTLTTDSISIAPMANINNYQGAPATQTATSKPAKLNSKETALTDTTSESPAPVKATTKPAVVNKTNSETISLLSEKQKNALISKFYLDLNAPVTWLGLDFSEMRILKKEAAKGAEKEENENILPYLFKEWNELVLMEKKRYDIAGALRHDKVTYNNNYISTKNDTININRLFVTDKNNLNYLSGTTIQKMVNAIPRESKKGYGVVFIVESLDNRKKETNTWVTLIDMKTGQVLITEKMRANAGGVGVRNFWARGFHNTINDVKERKYPEWKEQYKK